MGVRGNFHRETLGVRRGELVELLVRRGEELEDQGVGDSQTLHLGKESLHVVQSAAARIADYERGGLDVLLYVVDVLRQLLRRSERRLLPVQELMHGRTGAAADRAVEMAPLYGEHHGDRVAVPVLERLVPFQVQVTNYRAHDPPVIHVLIVQRVRDVGDGVVMLAPLVLPAKVGDALQRSSGLHGVHQLPQGFFGGIALHDHVHLRIAQKFLVEVGGGETAEEHLGLRMIFLDQLGDLQRTVGVGQPVQVNAEDLGLELGDELLHVQPAIVEHHAGQVHDANLVAVLGQVGGHGGEAERVHLEDRGGGDHVAHRPVEQELLPEVVNARRVQEYDVLFAHTKAHWHADTIGAI
ncbi:hypothetical protein DSECCO2_199140 [anaerobic digester metagenome]